MMFWLILLTVYVGLVVIARAVKEAMEQWYYRRLNQRTLECWRRERERTPYA